MCGRCAQHHAPPQVKKSKRKMRLSSAKPTSPRGMIETVDSNKEQYCPVHGYRDEIISENEKTRRVAGDPEENVTILMKCQISSCGHSDEATTEQVEDVISKKIHDSVEFTS